MSTRTNVGGSLDMSNLARLHFHTLCRSQQAAAIRRLAASGQGEHTIASATGLSVLFIRRVLAEAFESRAEASGGPESQQQPKAAKAAKAANKPEEFDDDIPF